MALAVQLLYLRPLFLPPPYAELLQLLLELATGAWSTSPKFLTGVLV
jgi:hypothetical protein